MPEDLTATRAMRDLDDDGLEAVLAAVYRHQELDFTGCKREGIARRIGRRMQVVGATSFAEYLAHLEAHADEVPQLINVLLVNVTGFFRDAEAWKALAQHLPTVLDLGGDGPVRVWSAGCASGEEPYTLAMLLAEVLGEEAFAERVKIFATDVDDQALADARRATYSARALEAVPLPLARRYFSAEPDGFVVSPRLRSAVIFGVQDLVQDAPIPRVDVLACRNVLMYFNPEVQAQILKRLRFALRPSGVLFVGKAETATSDLFLGADLEARLFSPIARLERARSAEAPRAALASELPVDVGEELRRASFDSCPFARMLFDGVGRLALANERAAELFALGPSDLGRSLPELDLRLSWEELRPALEAARLERRAVHLAAMERALAGGGRSYLDVEITPLTSSSGALVGTQLGFTDVTSSRRLRVELRRANAELEEARRTIDELEERLEAEREAIRSAREDVDLLNEELEATNEELQAITEELRRRTAPTSGPRATVDRFKLEGPGVLERERRVRAWNDGRLGVHQGAHAEVIWLHGGPSLVRCPSASSATSDGGEIVLVEEVR